MSIFRSAITGDDGTVDPGYLAVYWTMAVTVGIIPFVVLIGGIAVFKYPGAAEIIQSTGIGIGAICTGCGAVIGAVGLFRVGDTKHSSPSANTTISAVTPTTPAGSADKSAIYASSTKVTKRKR